MLDVISWLFDMVFPDFSSVVHLQMNIGQNQSILFLLLFI